MSKFVGIDIGASFIKGAIFDLDKLTVKKITKFPTPKPQKNISKKQSFHVRFEIDGKDYITLAQYAFVVGKIKPELSMEVKQ